MAPPRETELTLSTHLTRFGGVPPYQGPWFGDNRARQLRWGGASEPVGRPAGTTRHPTRHTTRQNARHGTTRLATTAAWTPPAGPGAGGVAWYWHVPQWPRTGIHAVRLRMDSAPPRPASPEVPESASPAPSSSPASEGRGQGRRAPGGWGRRRGVGGSGASGWRRGWRAGRGWGS